MKLRSFATLLVCAALAGCEGDTTLPDARLAGRWESNLAGIPATFPDGNRAVWGQVVLTLGSNGEFRREVRYLERAGGTPFPDAITEGTYTASHGIAWVTITRAYGRMGGAPATSVTLQPVEPRTETFAYSFEGGRLTFTPRCDPAALGLCIPEQFPHYTKVNENWR